MPQPQMQFQVQPQVLQPQMQPPMMQPQVSQPQVQLQVAPQQMQSLLQQRASDTAQASPKASRKVLEASGGGRQPNARSDSGIIPMKGSAVVHALGELEPIVWEHEKK